MPRHRDAASIQDQRQAFGMLETYKIDVFKYPLPPRYGMARGCWMMARPSAGWWQASLAIAPPRMR